MDLFLGRNVCLQKRNLVKVTIGISSFVYSSYSIFFLVFRLFLINLLSLFFLLLTLYYKYKIDG